ncbi:MAG: trigger factor [Elusimicrobiales bacterium]|nr:trigger factor [Elusimicrobiales bacterium]
MNLPLKLNDKIKRTNKEGCVYAYIVSVKDEDFNTVEQQALVRLQTSVSLPGFRTGKVPVNMIKEQFPKAVKDEIVDAAAKASISDMLKVDNITPVVTPLIKNVKFESEKSVEIEIQFECVPQFEVKGYKDIKATKKTHKVSDKDIDTYLKRVRDYNAYLKAVEGESVVIDKSHYIVFDYEAFEDGKKLEENSAKGELIEIANPGANQIAGLVDNVMGAKKGETREFDSEAGGRKLHFKVTINEIKTKISPEIDDKFLKEAGVKTIEELNANIRKMLERTESDKTEKDFTVQIEEELLKKNTLELPPTLIKQETKDLMEMFKKRMGDTQGKVKDETLVEKLKPMAERNLRIAYILHNIGEKEKIEVTEKDLQAELDKALASVPTEKEKEQIKDVFGKRKEYITATLRENKTMEFVKAKTSVKEEIN